MLLYIRHSKDKHNDKHKQDTKLTLEGKILSINRGQELIKKYGIPDIIYCSPFHRTRQTMKYMIKYLPDKIRKKIKIVYDPRASRFFSDEERQNVDISSSTQKMGVPIFETHQQLLDRLGSLMEELNNISEKGKIVWCITHTSVYKKFSYYYNIDIPSRIPYLHSFSC